MKKLDDIFRNRLARIREELNAYINDSFCGVRSEVVASSAVNNACEIKKRRGVQVKFLSYMKLNDDIPEDDDYLNEEEVYQNISNQEYRRNIDKVLQQKKETFSKMLFRLIDESGMKDSEVYKKANIDRRLFSKIRGDEKYMPSKKTAISFCLALQLNVEEARKLLETAGYTLSASSKFDLIIMYLMENKYFNIHFVNIVLEDYGEGTLSR